MTRFRRLLVAAAACALLGNGSAHAQPMSESEVKASYLFNFARFTEWPASAFASATAPLALCVLGSGDPLAGALAGIDGKPVGGHPLQVRLGVTAGQAKECHIVFVPAAETGRIGALMRALGAAPVLVVGDGTGPLDDGATIELRPQARRLGFAVHRAAERRAGLKISSQVLQLALEVRE